MSKRDEQVAAFMPLVRRIAYHFNAKTPASVDVDDLVQCGSIGLLNALNDWAPQDDTLFQTYASVRIRGEILDELRRNDPAPRMVREQLREIRRARSRLERDPSIGDGEIEPWRIAEEAGLSIEAYYGALMIETETTAPIDIESLEDEDLPQDEGADPGDDLDLGLLRTALENALEEIPHQEQVAIRCRYLLDMDTPEIRRELGGLSATRVYQLLRQGEESLRNELQDRL